MKNTSRHASWTSWCRQQLSLGLSPIAWKESWPWLLIRTTTMGAVVYKRSTTDADLCHRRGEKRRKARLAFVARRPSFLYQAAYNYTEQILARYKFYRSSTKSVCTSVKDPQTGARRKQAPPFLLIDDDTKRVRKQSFNVETNTTNNIMSGKGKL